MKSIEIRALITEDEPFLWDMLYQAVYVPEGQAPPPYEIVYQPILAWYVQEWGRDGDCGFLVSDESGQQIGAIWLRFAIDGHHGYGYVDDARQLSESSTKQFRFKRSPIS